MTVFTKNNFCAKSSNGRWKKSMPLVKEIYLFTKAFPKKEMYALTSQRKWDTISIPANIAEGLGSHYKKGTIQFLHISRSSMYELETLLNIAVLVEILKKTLLKSFFLGWMMYLITNGLIITWRTLQN
jgi:four helix bundle protein